MRPFSVLIIIFSLLASNSVFAETSDFPFFERPIRFRFHQGFFKHAGDVVEEILKTAQAIETVPGHPSRGVLRIPTETGREHAIHYNSLKPSFFIQDNQLVTRLLVDIEKSKVYAQPTGKCSVNLKGSLSFQVEARLRPSGKAKISLNQELYDDSGISYKTKKCGFLMKLGISAMIKSKLEEGIKEGFDEVFNNQELKYIEPVNFGKNLLDRNILVNQPVRNAYYTKSELASLPSQLNMELGFLGYLSNNKFDKMIQVHNPSSYYINEMGLDWAFSAGFRALSKNIQDLNYRAKLYKDGGVFPRWGEAPSLQLGQPIQFDTGIMIKESFLKNLFSTLYQAGFFNLQIQESLIVSPDWSINPLQRSDIFQVSLPTGEKLSAENYSDSRLNIVFSEVPRVEFTEKTILLEIPKLRMKYSVKPKNGEELTVVHFLARLSVRAKIELQNNGNIRLNFNDKPVQDFVIIERSGVAKDLSDEDIHQILNTDISQILKDFNMELPLVAGKKAVLKFLGISEVRSTKSNNVDKALSIYLDIGDKK